MSALARLAVLTVMHSLRVSGTASVAPALRGVQPSLAELYQPASSFRCIDSSKSIPFSNVNDDYCDCLDGSDEPGTSACSNGKFYCSNRGHVPLLLNASMVDDRICDCCDGSDEAPGACGNTCGAAGAAARAALRAHAQAAAVGARVREGYLRQAAKSLAEWRAEAQRLARAIAAQERLEQHWRDKQDAVEAQEAAERQREATLQAARDATAAALAAVQGSPAAAVGGGLQGAGSDSSDSTAGEPAAEEQESAGPGDAAPVAGVETAAPDPQHEAGLRPREEPAAPEKELAATEVPAAEAAEGESPEEAAKRIASQWIHSPGGEMHAAGEPTINEAADEQRAAEEGHGEEAPQEEEAPAVAPDQTHPLPPNGEEDAVTVPMQGWSLRGALARVRGWAVGALGWAATPEAERQRIRNRHREAAARLGELRHEQADVERRLSHNFGPDAQFLPLLGRCFTANVDKYIYEMCPYGSASQKDGAASTRLGEWAGWETGHAAMKFENGQHCWSGPLRSLQVSVACGAEEALSGVEEPNRCEYTARFLTPAACSRAAADALAAELAAAEAEVAALGGRTQTHEEL